MHKRTIALAAAALLIGGATTQASPQKQPRSSARTDGRAQASNKSETATKPA